METKPALRTTEFWLTLVAQLLTLLLQLTGHLPPEVGASIQTAGAGLYAVARGLAKSKGPPV